MSVLLKYVASSGNEYNLKTDGIKTKSANYHVWNWGVEGTTLRFGKRVSGFKRDAAVYTTRLMFMGSYYQNKALIESLHEDFEIDVRMKKPGRIIWGDYYIDCYIVNSSTEPDEKNIYTINDIEIYCPYPFWIKEEKKSFYGAVAPVGQVFLDYDYDFEYDYNFGSPGNSVWEVDFPFPAEFKMVIFGPVDTPRIMVNGYPYQINDTLDVDEYVTIDSRNNTVVKTLSSGLTANIFDLRSKEKSIFEPMPGGSMTFNWSGAFGFDVTLYEDRSEPRHSGGA